MFTAKGVTKIIDAAVRIYDCLRDDPMSLGGTVFDWSARAD
ncbi:MAG: hypothetical protein O2782_05925 [bacterium]|nr:hypothetical protein [bacterium]